MKKVLIMLSTYNGEKFLSEQLDSLYAQEGVDIHILVRDDGSKDNTVEILREYQCSRGNMTICAEANIGAALSFHTLISYATKEIQNYDYFAYADQDDVWMSNKIWSAVSLLESSTAKSKLYCCMPELVDSELRPLPSKHIRICNNLKGNIITNHILGCTQVFNGVLLNLISMYNPNPAKHKVPLHDAWTALVAYAFNSEVIVDTRQFIKYRQHANNVVGSNINFFETQKSRIKRYINGQSIKSNKCKLMLDVYSNILDKNNKDVLTECTAYKQDFNSKMNMLFDREYYQYDLITNIGAFLMILFNKF